MRPDPAAPADMITLTTVVLCFFLAVTPAHYARKVFFFLAADKLKSD